MKARRAARLARRTLRALAVLALGLAAAGALATERSNTSGGRRSVSGGVGGDEMLSLHERGAEFSLRAVTAVRRSGAHLSDVRIRIADAQEHAAFDEKLAGPWLCIDLPVGRFTSEASFNGETQNVVTTIHPGVHHQASFHFDVPDEVSPEMLRPFPGDPYDR